jgi:hypothetical protein
VKVIKHATRLKGLDESELRPIKALYEEFYMAVHGTRPAELNIASRQHESSVGTPGALGTPALHHKNTSSTNSRSQFVSNVLSDNASEGPQRTTTTRSKIGGALGNILRKRSTMGMQLKGLRTPQKAPFEEIKEEES